MSWLNASALRNILLMFVAFDVSQSLMSSLKLDASEFTLALKIVEKFLTFPTSQVDMSPYVSVAV